MLLFPPLIAFAAWIALRVARGVRPAWRGTCDLALKWGLRLGLAGLIAGYVGPVLFAPGSNQGPLLGIFVLGPLAYVIGACVGLLGAGANVAPDDES